MSQQALDLRRSVQIVRRHKILVGIVVALGILGGAAYAVLKPPMLTSTALVALPQSTQTAEPVATTTSGTDPFTATQEVIAGTYQVLVNALPDVRPAMSAEQLRHDVQVGSPAPDIISISAKGKNAADAEATANAVASSYVAYVNSPTSPGGHVSAQLLEPATSASGPAPTERKVIFALVGALAGALVGAIVALAVGRIERRLRERDEIANSIGVPVFASFPVAHPSDAAGWTKLLEDYKPPAVDAYRLRQALQQLGAASVNGSNGNGRDRASFTVMSLSSDPGAFAIGPQLAVFAASQGIPTTLVIGPQQDAKATATLRTACAVPPPASSKRQSRLQVAVIDGDVDPPPDAALTVVVAVVDGQYPQVPNTVRTAATVLGVSAGAATAEQLARAAMSAALDGREIAGIVVADPEPEDRTTGRIPQLQRPTHRRLPTRLKGMTTEIKR
jgi:capsular polysaccharide biosynthesis protein